MYSGPLSYEHKKKQPLRPVDSASALDSTSDSIPAAAPTSDPAPATPSTAKRPTAVSTMTLAAISKMAVPAFKVCLRGCANARSGIFVWTLCARCA